MCKSLFLANRKAGEKVKEGFFKKIAIGVAVSLMSTAVIAGVSGLFSGVGSGGSGSGGGNGGNNDVCKHETRTTDKEIAPTCILGGVSGMVRCLDCGEIVVEGEELPPTGHIGEVGETCTVCNEPIYGQYQNANIYTLQDIESGEKVAGNWYRIYLLPEEEQYANNIDVFAILRFSSDSVSLRCPWGGLLRVYTPNCYNCPEIKDFIPAIYGVDSFGNYVDVYFEEGATISDTYPDGVDEDGNTIYITESFVIDKDTTISDFWRVKRLLFGE